VQPGSSITPGKVNPVLPMMMRSPARATAFVPKLGYARITELVHASVSRQRPLIELAIEQGQLTHEEVLDTSRESTDDHEPAT
jgi:aspartate ammonia-lyase